MPSLAKAILIGRVGKDSDLKYTAKATAMLTWSLAVDGYKEDSTSWFHCVYFGDGAERIGDWVKKGRLLFVEGRLESTEWEKDGVRQRGMQVVVQKVDFLDGGKGKKKNDGWD